MALPDRARRKQAMLYGSATPRLSPPTPARADLAGLRETAAGMGITLMPWQETAGRYLTATGPDKRNLYREVAIVVARQNGKTLLMKPYIIRALRAGLKVMHLAQVRELPRHMFRVIADALSDEPDLFPKRRGRTIWPRYGSGQEEIILANGGEYRITAANQGGGRGWSNDLIVFDELREAKSHEVINAVKPTLAASDNPQIVYLSNAGTEESVVLNGVKARANGDPALAYLEWSADPDLGTDDEVGWLAANPSVGHMPGLLDYLRGEYRSMSLEGNLQIFNTEHLCRWTPTDLPGLLPQSLWDSLRTKLPASVRPSLAVSLDPAGTRASVAVAWQQQANDYAVRSVGDVTGNPIDVDALGRDIKALGARLGAGAGGYDPETDALLAKYLRNPTSVVGAKFTAACSTFVNLATSKRLHWEGPDAMSEDIRWTARLTDPQDGTFRAIKAKEDRPITSILAAIRALSLASGPPRIRPKVL